MHRGLYLLWISDSTPYQPELQWPCDTAGEDRWASLLRTCSQSPDPISRYEQPFNDHKWSSQENFLLLIWRKMIWNKNRGERRSSITSVREEEVIPSQPAASLKDFQARQSVEQMRYYAWEPRRQGGESGQVLQLSLQPKQNECCQV